MKLTGFRIQNFRSIIDTGWTYLSPDNITGLIGQNESGKTSILEALNSFFTGTISEDILRSDLSLPCVHCIFEIIKVDVEKELNEKILPDGVIDEIKKKENIFLKRSWGEDITSHIELAGDKVLEIYRSFYGKREKEEKNIKEKIEEAINEHDNAIRKSEKAFSEKEEKHHELEAAKEKLTLLQKKHKARKNGENSNTIKDNITETKKYLEECRNIHVSAGKNAEILASEARKLSKNANLARESIQAEKKFLINKKELEESYKELQKCQRIFDISYDEKERRASRTQLDSSNETYVRVLRDYEQSKEDAILKKIVAFKVLSGDNIDEVKNKIKKEKPHIDKYYSLEEAG